MATREPSLIDPRMAKALEHPIRIEILDALRAGPSSPTRIQRELENVSLNLVSHHVKVLKELGVVELLETVSKRGAKEHIYRLARWPVIQDETWDTLTPKRRLPIAVTILRMISRDLASSFEAGLFDETPDIHVTRTPLKLDQEGWSEVAAVLVRSLEEVNEIGLKSSERLEDSDEAPVAATVAILNFPTGRGDVQVTPRA